MSISIKPGSLDRDIYFGPTFLRGMIYILAVAIFITVFELIFFVVYIAPQEKKNILYKLTNIKTSENNKGHSQYKSVDDIIKMFDDDKSNITSIKAYINTMNDRENILNEKINNDAIAFICIEVFIFILIIYLIYNKLQTYITSDNNLNIGLNTYYGTGILSPIVNAFITTIILAIFQINMYFFAHKWKFPSDFEIDYAISSDLKNYLN